MLKAQPLCTGAASNLGDRVLGEVEKNNFIALPGNGGHSGLLPLKLCVPTQEDLMSFRANDSRMGLLNKISVCAAPTLLIWSQVIFFFFFWPYHAAGGILDPPTRDQTVPPALGAWSLNHWTARQVPQVIFSMSFSGFFNLASGGLLWYEEC